MPEEPPRKSDPERKNDLESFIHFIYRIVFAILLLLFLILAGLDILLEKADPVIRRWHTIGKVSASETSPAPNPNTVWVAQCGCVPCCGWCASQQGRSRHAN